MHRETPLTLSDWHLAYQAGASPRELLAALRSRLLADSPESAWISHATAAQLDAQLSTLQAREVAHRDRESALRAMPLFGVPFAVKDNIDVADAATTAACPAFEYIAPVHSTVVARLIDAGAVWMGKTNLDQFATGLVGTRSPYGRPSSTFSNDHVSGGSSSGSAVAVSRGDVPFALGTDTAGSGRVPAGFNNIVGLKPTPGRVSNSGVLPACRSIDCVSIFALTASDAAHVLAVIEGADARDPYCDFRVGVAQLPAKLRVAIPLQPLFNGDAGYEAAFGQAVAHVRALGHSVEEINFAPLFAIAELLYGGPWVAERHTVVQSLLEREPQALDRTVRSVVEMARDFTATDAFRAQYRVREARRDIAALWQDVDLLMVPTAPGHPRHAEVDADPIGANAVLGTYTNFVNLLGFCALAMPAGITDKALPFGVTFIAPGASDAALARFGHTWQASLGLALGATSRKLEDTDAVIDIVTPWPASEQYLPIAVVGAHLSGLPLNGQLTERGARLREATLTSPRYRLYALPNTTPPKPGLLRVESDGASIAVEVWEMPSTAVGSFLALIPPPLGLGSVELADGRHVYGFLCESHALASARDVTAFGGWRAYLASL
jgi:allophanate hydrolase